MKNVENSISEPLGFKISWGWMVPIPPYKPAPLALISKPSS